MGSERRQAFFEKIGRDTRLFSDEDYGKIYALHREHWGIGSPACNLPKRFFDEHPYPEVLPEIEGDVLVAINRDSVPNPDLVRYLIEHEHWEAYVRRRHLKEADSEDFKRPILERKRPAHRFAIRKELQLAEAEGRLDEYMEWWREFYQADIERIRGLPDEEIARISKNYGEGSNNREMIIHLIQSNLRLREEAYKKI